MHSATFMSPNYTKSLRKLIIFIYFVRIWPGAGPDSQKSVPGLPTQKQESLITKT